MYKAFYTGESFEEALQALWQKIASEKASRLTSPVTLLRVTRVIHYYEHTRFIQPHIISYA